MFSQLRTHDDRVPRNGHADPEVVLATALAELLLEVQVSPFRT
jgi:hypothetical protein